MNQASKSMCRLLLCLTSLFILTSCGGGGGGASVDPAPTPPAGTLEVGPISDSTSTSSDDELVTVRFSDQPPSAGVQAGVLTAGGAKLDPTGLRWLSQYSDGCAGYFAFCSHLGRRRTQGLRGNHQGRQGRAGLVYDP